MTSRRQALPAIALGHVVIAVCSIDRNLEEMQTFRQVVMVLNGTIGARLHIAFPVLNRSSFGFWFSYFSVVSRAVLAMFWFGIQVTSAPYIQWCTFLSPDQQTYTGSECIYQMLKAIWPSTARIPNRLPESSNITTVG